MFDMVNRALSFKLVSISPRFNLEFGPLAKIPTVGAATYKSTNTTVTRRAALLTSAHDVQATLPDLGQ
jgi:hypothetical protein